jgi:hypothetical protein
VLTDGEAVRAMHEAARARIVERYSLETLLRDSKAALKALCADRGTR